ncbi:MAG: GFA family protein [Brevundimonas sp.]|nr:MAG: GFA family protein [Brevundimonas sp.]
MTEVQTHRGSCHCGAVAYEVDTDLSQVIDCNCSHCFRKGLWLTFVKPEAFRLRTGEPQLAEYLFNKHNIHHHFCPTCGVEPFGRGTDPGGEPMVAVNIRTLTDIEPFSIKPSYRFDGRHKF